MNDRCLSLPARLALRKRERRAGLIVRLPREYVFKVDALAEFKGVTKDEIVENAMKYAISKLIQSLPDEDQARIAEMVKRKLEVL